ncbi:MAG: invasion associated locus B family protein [Beijerinckiaceae bacterium]
MRKFRSQSAYLLAFATLLTAHCGCACAQQSATATYADWVLQCAEEAGPPPKKTCEIAQVTRVQGNKIPFSRVAVEAPSKGQPVKLIVQLPVNISLDSQVGIRSADGDPGISAPFHHCMPTGCFAEFELNDKTLNKFYASEGAGKVTFKDAGGGEIGIPLSFSGFRQAFDALSKE